jgi:hypothetical protein
VWQHVESLLIEHHEGHHVYFCRCGESRSSAKTQGGREGSTFDILVFPLVYLFLPSPLLVPLSFSRHREGGKERTLDGVHRYKGVQG